MTARARRAQRRSSRPHAVLRGARLRAAARSRSIVALAVAWELFARSRRGDAVHAADADRGAGAHLDRRSSPATCCINIGVTLYRALAGFCDRRGGRHRCSAWRCRASLGVHWFFDPIISVGFPMPKIAFLPVIILWLGVYDVSKISMVVLDAIFPVVTATIVGIRGVERELLWSARNMGASDRELLWQIALPAALPQIMTGLQVALPIALIVAVVTEMLMGGYGLGGAMMTASRFADSRGVFAGIVEIAVVGYVLVKGMAILRRRLLLWHQEALAPSTV